jgi:hypothetical protein
MVVACGCLAGQANAYVFWSNTFSGWTIGSSNLDGTGANQELVAAQQPYGLAASAGYVYWGSQSTDSVGRAKFDGSAADPKFIRGGSDVMGVEVDSQHVYWTNVNGTIGRADLDGSNVNQSFIAGGSVPFDIAVDGQYIYWANSGSGTIGANLDGSNVNQSFMTGLAIPRGLAVDASYIYWAEVGGPGNIGRANLNGSSPNASFMAVSNPSGVAVYGGHLYWTDQALGRVGRANVDGSSPNPGFISGGAQTVGVAVAADPVLTLAASVPSLALGRKAVGSLTGPTKVQLTNTGNADLEVDRVRSIGDDGDDFLVSRDDCSRNTLTPGASCTLAVRFGPIGVGKRNSVLTVDSDATGSPLRVPLVGTGLKPRTASKLTDGAHKRTVKRRCTTRTRTVKRRVEGKVRRVKVRRTRCVRKMSAPKRIKPAPKRKKA